MDCCTKSRVFRPSKALTNGMSPLDEYAEPIYKEAYFPNVEEDLNTFENPEIFNYDLVDQHFTEVEYYPEIAANIELTSSLNETPFDSYSNLGSYLRSIESYDSKLKYSTMSDFSNNLPELDKDSITEALNEIENQTTMQSAPETEPMEMDRPDTEEDVLSPITSPQIRNIFCDSIDDTADRPDWEDIFSQQSSLIEQFVEIVENQSTSKEVVTCTTSQSSPVRDCEGLQCSTTQCNFAEDREKDRRQRNNMASRKSRAMKKERFAAMQSEIDQLRAANRKLKAIVQELDSVIDEAKAIVLPQKE